jgi:hypothetical protein
MVCQRCGHKDLSHEAIGVLEQIKDGSVRPVRHELLRIFDYNQVTHNVAGFSIQDVVHYALRTGDPNQQMVLTNI